MGLNNYFEKIKKIGFLKSINFLEKSFEDQLMVSLDIGACSVKVVQLKKTPKGYLLQKAGYKEIDKSSEAQGKSEEVQIVKAIQDLWNEQKIKIKKVKLVISDPAVYSRHIGVPRVAEDELKNAIRWQAEKYVSFPIDDAVVDFQLLGSDVKKDDSQMDIVLVAAEKKTIDKYLDILNKCGLIPVVINVSCFAVAKALLSTSLLKENEIVPIVDMGCMQTSITVVKGTELQLVRNIDWGGNHVTMALRKALNIGHKEAENMKKGILFFSSQNDGEGQQVKYFSYIESILSELISQLDRSLSYCEREFTVEKIKKIVLCGGCANFKGLDNYLADKLGLTIEIADPFVNIEINKEKFSASVLEEISPKLMAAFGGIFDETG